MSDCLTCENYINTRCEFLLRNITEDGDNRTFDLRLLRRILKDTIFLTHRVPHQILTPITFSSHGVEYLFERYHGLQRSVVNFLRLYGWPEECIHQALYLDLQEIRRRPIEPDTVSVKESRLMFLLPVIPEIPN